MQFHHKTVAQVACEAVLLLVDRADRLLALYPDIPPRIVEVRNLLRYLVGFEFGASINCMSPGSKEKFH